MWNSEKNWKIKNVFHIINSGGKVIKCPINYLDVDYPFKLLKAIGNPVSSKRFENHYYAAGRCNMNAIAAKHTHHWPQKSINHSKRGAKH